MTTIKTIRRAKWHGDYEWQATDADGQAYAYQRRPTACWFGGMWRSNGGFRIAPRRGRCPNDFRTTLRRTRTANPSRRRGARANDIYGTRMGPTRVAKHAGSTGHRAIEKREKTKP